MEHGLLEVFVLHVVPAKDDSSLVLGLARNLGVLFNADLHQVGEVGLLSPSLGFIYHVLFLSNVGFIPTAPVSTSA